MSVAKSKAIHSSLNETFNIEKMSFHVALFFFFHFCVSSVDKGQKSVDLGYHQIENVG